MLPVPIHSCPLGRSCSHKWQRLSVATTWIMGTRKADKPEEHGHLGTAPGVVGRREHSGLVGFKLVGVKPRNSPLELRMQWVGPGLRSLGRG